MTQFPWKGLLQILAERGCYLVDYPTIRLPGQVYAYQSKSKAISDLLSTEVTKFGAALGLIPLKKGQKLLQLKSAKGELKEGTCLVHIGIIGIYLLKHSAKQTSNVAGALSYSGLPLDPLEALEPPYTSISNRRH